MENLKVVMLSNGDQLLGEFSGPCYDGYYLVKQPLIIKEVVTSSGVGSISTIFPSKDEKVELNKNHICMGPATPNDKLTETYMKRFSNLVLPKVV
jgi:hypothetical protein